MTNNDVVSAFVEVLLQNPELTMQAVALRLSASDYELKLLKADVCREHYKRREEATLFAMETGQRNIWEVND